MEPVAAAPRITECDLEVVVPGATVEVEVNTKDAEAAEKELVALACEKLGRPADDCSEDDISRSASRMSVNMINGKTTYVRGATYHAQVRRSGHGTGQTHADACRAAWAHACGGPDAPPECETTARVAVIDGFDVSELGVVTPGPDAPDGTAPPRDPPARGIVPDLHVCQVEVEVGGVSRSAKAGSASDWGEACRRAAKRACGDDPCSFADIQTVDGIPYRAFATHELPTTRRGPFGHR